MICPMIPRTIAPKNTPANAKTIHPSQFGDDSQHTAGTLQNSSMILFITDIITEIRGK